MESLLWIPSRFFSSYFMILWATSFLYSSQKAGILFTLSCYTFPMVFSASESIKKKKRKKRLHRGKRQWHFVPFSLEDSFSYHTRRSCLFRILASTGPYFLPLLVPSLPDCFRAGIWDWRKKKRKMEIFDSFFSFFFFLTIRKYFVSKPKLKNFWSSLCFLFFFFCCCWGRGFVFDWDHGY